MILLLTCVFIVISNKCGHKKQGRFPASIHHSLTGRPDSQDALSQRALVIWIENSLVRRKFQLSKRIFKLTKETGHKERPDW